MPGATRTPFDVSAITVVLTLLHALVSFGCSSNEGGIGGSAGLGGVGGAPLREISTLRVAHVAVGAPPLDVTELDFIVTDQGSFNGISFGRATQSATLPSDLHELRVAEPGGMVPLASVSWELETDVGYTVAAYRKSDAVDALALLVVDEAIDDLEMGRGRVVIGHAADDGAWATVDVVHTGTNEVVAADLAPGEQSDPIDLEAGAHELGFSITSAPPAIDAGPFSIEVGADETTVLIVVDADVSDGSVEGAVYVLKPTTVGTIPSISLR